MKLVTATIALALFSSTPMASDTHDHSHDMMKFSVGEPGKGIPDHSISVSMQDTMRFVFEPALGDLKNGEIIEFNVSNDGQIRHEFSIGNADGQVKHSLMMQKCRT